jgi:diamine N-acetyltransferase
VSKKCIPPLEKDAVCLRLLEKSDLERTLSWRNQNRQYFFNSDLLSMHQHIAWFNQYLARDDDYVFIIERLSRKKEPVGQISLYKIDWEKRQAEFGRLLIGEPAAKRMGIANIATEILLDYAFTNLGIETIQLEVLPGNSPAILLYEKCGFIRTAVHADAIIMTKKRIPHSGFQDYEFTV